MSGLVEYFFREFLMIVDEFLKLVLQIFLYFVMSTGFLTGLLTGVVLEEYLKGIFFVTVAIFALLALISLEEGIVDEK